MKGFNCCRASCGDDDDDDDVKMLLSWRSGDDCNGTLHSAATSCSMLPFGSLSASSSNFGSFSSLLQLFTMVEAMEAKIGAVTKLVVDIGMSISGGDWWDGNFGRMSIMIRMTRLVADVWSLLVLGLPRGIMLYYSDSECVYRLIDCEVHSLCLSGYNTTL